MLLLLTALPVCAQHVRTKALKDFDFSPVTAFELRTGSLYGHHPRLNEGLLRANLEAKLIERAAAKGLRPSALPGPARVILTYTLSAREDTEVERRGPRRVRKDVTRFTLEIRMLDAGRREVWTAIGTDTVADRRHAKVEEHILRAVTFAFAKYPPKKD